MDALRALLEGQPLLALFLTIGLGYALGAVGVRGLGLGVGAVLFVGLAVGAFAPASAPPALVSSIGLVLFLYGIGIQYGRQFVAGLRSRAGRVQNLLGLVGLAAGTAAAAALVIFADIPIGYAAGLYAGSLTSTPTLQAAIEAVGSSDPSIGYGVAYPVGVLGPILCFSAALAIVRPKIRPPESSALLLSELDVRNPELAGEPLAALAQRLPAGAQIAALRRDGVDLVPQPELRLEPGDDLLVVGDPQSVERARALLGELVAERLDADKLSAYLRVFVSRGDVVGRSLADLNLPASLRASVVNVRRGDAELYPTPELRLEHGDRIGVLSDPENFPAVRAFFGGSIRGTAELSYISLGIGMVLGVAVGLLRIPLPGVGSFSLGLAGGPLVVALLLGYLGRTGRLTWTIPPSANLTLRTFGLTLFLATVGLNTGDDFVATVQGEGARLLLAAAAIVLASVVTTLVVGNRLLRIPYDELLGVAAGVTGNPAILAFADRAVQTERPDVSYAMIFPGATILKIVVVQLLVAALG